MDDLIIIGGGPTGLAAAIEASLAGLSAIVFETRPYPIDKACGEGLMPAGVESIKRLGVDQPEGRPFIGIRIVTPRGSADGDFTSGTGLAVRRTELSRVLRNRAEGVGVRFVHARVGRLRQADDLVEVNGLPARWAIAADGLHSSTARRLDIPVRVGNRPRWGIRAHFEARPWTDRVEIHYGMHGEAYVTPVSERTVGIALLTEKLAPFEELLADYPDLRERLGVVIRKVTSDRGAGPFPRLARRRVEGRILLAGDAAGFLDPVTGEGVQLGFAGARLAVDAICSGAVEAYDVNWWRMVRSYWWMTTALLAIRRTRLLDRMLVPTLRTVPGLFDRSLDLLGGRTALRRTSKDQTGGSVIGPVVPDPVQQHTGAIPESDQLDEVERKPGQPGGIPV